MNALKPSNNESEAARHPLETSSAEVEDSTPVGGLSGSRTRAEIMHLKEKESGKISLVE